ncbi:MAG: signal peptidase I [Candidatus Aenigmarchaeota archaeon]|nr:signal peptidase I [Candidatus Aenigmarchaeota archaeon]
MKLTVMFRSIKNNYVREALEVAFYFFVAWLFYHGLAFALDTPMPIVSVVSNSMEPILYRGDLLLVTGVDNPAVGDIVIYEHPQARITIVHRIIGITDEGYVLKGDHNAAPDRAIVTKEQVLGKVWIAMPLLGYPRLLLYAVGV